MLLIQIRVDVKVVEMLNLARLHSSVPTKSRKMMALNIPSTKHKIENGARLLSFTYISQLCYQYVRKTIEENDFDSFAQ